MLSLDVFFFFCFVCSLFKLKSRQIPYIYFFFLTSSPFSRILLYIFWGELLLNLQMALIWVLFKDCSWSLLYSSSLLFLFYYYYYFILFCCCCCMDLYWTWNTKYKHLLVHTHIHTYTHTQIHRYKDTHIHRYTDTKIQRYKDTHIHIYTHTHTHTYTHIHTHTHTHTNTIYRTHLHA